LALSLVINGTTPIMKKSLIYFTTILFLFYLYSCSSNDEPTVQAPASDCSTVSATFSKDVSPIISSNCATTTSCHAAGSANGVGPLTSYTQVFNNRNQIKTVVSNGTMPKDRTLSSDQKSKIICWVESGAANN
jgi:hypothetical protein